jgi:hypothetical protein
MYKGCPENNDPCFLSKPVTRLRTLDFKWYTFEVPSVGRNVASA